MEDILKEYRSFLFTITLQHPIGISGGTGTGMLDLMNKIEAFAKDYVEPSKEKAREYLKAISNKQQKEELRQKLYELRLEVYSDHVPANLRHHAVGLRE